MKTINVIGYTYESDMHCVHCTEIRFKTKDLDPETPIQDDEGNEIHPMFDYEEHGYTNEDTNEYLEPTCGDCFEEIE